MDNQDPKSAVKYLVGITRRITRVTQLAPFVYLLFLAVLLLAEPLLPDTHVRWIDKLSAIPVYVSVSMLGLGRLLKLCRWFISACLLPILPKTVGYIDSFVVTLYQEEVILANTLIGIAYIAFLILSFCHFFYGREKGVA